MFRLLRIEIDNDFRRPGMALTGENETRGQLIGLQRIIEIHLHLAFYKSRPAGTTNAAFTGKGQVRPFLQGRVQHRCTLKWQREYMTRSVDPDRSLADPALLPGRHISARFLLPYSPRTRRLQWMKELKMDLFLF